MFKRRWKIINIKETPGKKKEKEEMKEWRNVWKEKEKKE